MRARHRLEVVRDKKVALPESYCSGRELLFRVPSGFPALTLYSPSPMAFFTAGHIIFAQYS
jgi:hypothetical protein